MPKVVSRFVVSSSEHQKQRSKSAKAVLRSYYCLCGDFLLVVQGKLDRLPRRQSDGSYIIRSKDAKDGKTPGRKFKLNAVPGDRFLLKRKGTETMEIRQPFMCGRCNVTVAYQTTAPPAGSGPFLYILRGAMTELQGRIPDDAFEGEDEVLDEDDLANELDEPGQREDLMQGVIINRGDDEDNSDEEQEVEDQQPGEDQAASGQESEAR